MLVVAIVGQAVGAGLMVQMLVRLVLVITTPVIRVMRVPEVVRGVAQADSRIPYIATVVVHSNLSTHLETERRAESVGSELFIRVVRANSHQQMLDLNKI
jgi:hypothetical protein